MAVQSNYVDLTNESNSKAEELHCSSSASPTPLNPQFVPQPDLGHNNAPAIGPGPSALSGLAET